MPNYNLPKDTQKLIDAVFNTPDFDPYDALARHKLTTQAENWWPTFGRKAIHTRVTNALRYLRTLDIYTQPEKQEE
jgi:hypothetical protein